ncbi:MULTISPECIES: UDP-4-amino-4,6-dideoxy-N-acetyl-beta-L-altrosamine N-acetyltransferase [Saccharibacillus]|uniref:UDP-4-amino-4, 6-dideoxy-N-acetyl-beta-L-altrosamine N-acetyltransferase n=1 Tax=Saccharibacillus TaxID=456492 RepID=UPI00123BFDDD|nr:UDP-4-amino-4,6-dideoxy-N-acetyl-beta-L-altrosamine N-acetyltransferase [Saccharibacillus sp. WB 17]MWJ33318.1 UDP-4-amino-4,6-dideoxy-N-acetyl-beta-L-altrosamine N-acetyltransferase [Saccharibacillus sp. WB 17]
MNIGSYSMRPISEEDLPKLLEWRNSDPIRSKMITDHFITMEEHLKWFEKIKQYTPSLHFVFEYEAESAGYIGYTDRDTASGTCSSGLYIGLQTGLPPVSAFAIEFLMLDYAFKQLEVRKLCAGVFAFNRKVIRLHNLFGFHQEGILQRHVLKNGNYEDFLLMAAFADEWIEKRNEFHRYFK